MGDPYFTILQTRFPGSTFLIMVAIIMLAADIIPLSIGLEVAFEAGPIIVFQDIINSSIGIVNINQTLPNLLDNENIMIFAQKEVPDMKIEN